ncbi:MAG TPA: energy transducer TonB [Candidatus Angelobacter sp.]|nr:energy transducer TonB [Candidatus Angelobacter sp.]
MPNRITLALISVLKLAIACLMLPAAGGAQVPDATRNQAVPIHVPSAATDILHLAKELNGLDAGDTKPWHLKASWDEFDSDGDNVRSGTFEEFYAGPKRYKQIYAGDSLQQTEVANDTGLYRAGDQRWPNLVEYQVRNAVLRPLYLFRTDKPERRLDKQETSFSTGKMPCVVLHSTGNMIVLPAPLACFQPDTVMLRFIRTGLNEDVSYSSIVQFQGHYIAKEIALISSGKPQLKIHVDELGEITKVDDTFFAPPAGATRIGGRIPAPPLYVDDYAISAPVVMWPERMEGKVKAKIVVGKDGGVIEASASDGPAKMQKAVLAALKQYRFRPFYVLNEPVEVEFEMTLERHVR